MPRKTNILNKNIIKHTDIIEQPILDIPPNRIRLIRLINNMNIKDLSKKLNISVSMLQQIETQKKAININTLLLISEIFNVSIDYILYQSSDIKYNSNKQLVTNIIQLKNFFEGNEELNAKI